MTRAPARRPVDSNAPATTARAQTTAANRRIVVPTSAGSRPAKADETTSANSTAWARSNTVAMKPLSNTFAAGMAYIA